MAIWPMLERPNEAPAVAAVAGLMASPPGFSHHTRNRSAIGSRCRQVPQQEPAGGAGIGIIRLCAAKPKPWNGANKSFQVVQGTRTWFGVGQLLLGEAIGGKMESLNRGIPRSEERRVGKEC